MYVIMFVHTCCFLEIIFTQNIAIMKDYLPDFLTSLLRRWKVSNQNTEAGMVAVFSATSQPQGGKVRLCSAEWRVLAEDVPYNL